MKDFFYNESNEKNIERLKMRGNLNTKQNKIELIVYLIELMFDLIIAPRDNISSSPGFESIFGAIV